MSNEAQSVIEAAYAAFGRGDLPAIRGMLSDDRLDWTFHGAAGMPYTGSWHSADEVIRWFESIPRVEEIEAFEPREIIAAGEHVTVLGWERTRSRATGRIFESDWVHVFTVRGGRIVRFWGLYDTQAAAGAHG